MINIGVSGSSGKMGTILIDEINNAEHEYRLSGKYHSTSSDDELQKMVSSSDVIIDFSTPNILKNLLSKIEIFKIPIVICTTGFKNDDFLLMKNVSKIAPILYAANSSIGANIVALLAPKIANLLNEYDIEIIDYHHRYKKDAPSGTALMIGNQIAKSMNINLNKIDLSDKSNRAKGDIGFSSIRAGNIFGKHEVIFAGENEEITIKHQVFNRAIFAKGALLAAKWLIKHKSGFFLMEDIVGEIFNRQINI